MHQSTDDKTTIVGEFILVTLGWIAQIFGREKLHPNHITGFGIVLLAPTIILYKLDRLLACFPVMTFRFLLDVLDGWFARKTKQTSKFGAQFDTLGDKLGVLVICIFYVEAGWLPGWMLMAIMTRESGISMLRVHMAGYGDELPSNKYGKAKMWVQGTVLCAVLLLYHLAGANIIPAELTDIISYGLLLSATVITVVFGIPYLVEFRKWKKARTSHG